MNFTVKYILFFISNILSFLVVAQTPFYNEVGMPFIKNYPPKIYKGDSQIWCVIQDKRGVMYFGSKDGVIEFDGNNWKKITTGFTVRSLNIDEKGRIYVGGSGDFGYLYINENNTIKFESLTSFFNSDSLLLNHYINVIDFYQEKVFFKSLKQILVFNKKTLETKIITPTDLGDNEGAFTHYYGDKFYLRDRYRGILEFVNGEFKPIKNAESFIDKGVTFILPYSEDKLIYGLQFTKEVFFYDKNTGEISLWEDAPKIYEEAIDGYIFNSGTLSDGSFILATLTKGLIRIFKNGTYQVLDKNNGLFSEGAYSFYEIENNGVWLGLKNGIAYTEMGSNLTHWNEYQSLIGSVYDVARYKGDLYVSTNSGTFRLENERFIQEQNRQLKLGRQCWDLLNWKSQLGKESLLIANNRGVFEVSEKGTNNIRKRETATGAVFSLVTAPNDSAILWLGMSNGVAKMRQENGVWINVNTLVEKNIQARSMICLSDSVIIASSVNQGVVKITLSNKGEFKKEWFRNFLDLSGENINRIFNTSYGVLAATKKGIYRYNAVLNNFEKYDNILPDLYRNRDVYTIREASNGNLWIGFGDSESPPLCIAKQVNSEEFIWEDRSFKRLEGMPRVTIRVEDENAWIGGPDGLFLYKKNTTSENTSYAFKTILRSIITSKDSVLYNGNLALENYSKIFKAEQASKIQELGKSTQIPYENNGIIFNFSSNYFTEPNLIKYQYKLLGFENEWSDWSNKHEKEYTNLNYGKYTFIVKAKNVYDDISEMAKYSFTIATPWYHTRLAYVTYFILSSFTVWGVAVIYSKRYKREKERLEKIIKERTKEIRLQKDNIEEQAQTLLIKNLEIATQTEELQIINERLVELGEFKQSMIGMIVHDLKNPISAIIGLTEGEFKPLHQRKLNQSGKVLLNLVLNILEVQKLEEASTSLQLTTFNLRTLIKSAYSEVQMLAEEKNHQVNLHADENIRIKADHDMILRVVINLLTNAIKFTPLNGMITIGCVKESDSLVKVYIEDNGIGIPKEKQEKIFDKFSQLETLKSGKARSTGLGLTFCKLAIEAHEGKIGVESSEDKGAKFWFSLLQLKDNFFEQVNDKVKNDYLTTEIEENYLKSNDTIIVKPIIDEIKKYEVYDLTDIKKLLKTVPDDSSQSIIDWKNALEETLYTCNAEKFKKLVNEVE